MEFSVLFSIVIIPLLAFFLFFYHDPLNERFALLVFKDTKDWKPEYLRHHFGVDLDIIRLSTETFSSNTRRLKRYKGIIPGFVPEAIALGEYKFSNAIVSKPGLITTLDDKATVGEILAPELAMITEIPGINSHESTLQEIDAFNKWVAPSDILCKPAEGIGSREQIVLPSNETRLIQELPDVFMCQPYMEKHDKFGVNIFAWQGKLRAMLIGKANGGLPRWKYLQGYYTQIIDIDSEEYSEEIEKMVEFIESAIERLDLQGIMEFEFLQYKDALYFLEINPRLSGVQTMVTDRNRSPFIDQIIVPYLEALGEKIIRPDTAYDYFRVDNECCFVYKHSIDRWHELNEEGFISLFRSETEYR